MYQQMIHTSHFPNIKAVVSVRGSLVDGYFDNYWCSMIAIKVAQGKLLSNKRKVYLLIKGN